MLLADGCPNTVEDLRVYESAILDLARTETIDLKTKLGLAAEEVSEEVLDFLLDAGRVTDPQAGSRRQIGVGDVAVTRQLKRWHAVHTVMLVYRDALHNQLNSRYWEQYCDYRKLTRDARAQTERFGVGIVASPIPRAAKPVLSTDAGAAAGATFYVRVVWVDAFGREGAPSEPMALEVPDGSVLVVNAADPPAVAAGYNVYIGVSEAELARQNASAVAIGTPFTMPIGGLIAGPAPGDGQAPDSYATATRILRRG